MSDSVIDALVKLAPAVIALHATQRSRCILATRIGCEVLRYFAIPHAPLAVNVRLMNAAGLAWVKSGEPGTADEVKQAGVHVIEIHEGIPGPGWSGHLVIEVPGGILDLDLQQFQRPEKAIALPHAASFEINPTLPWAYLIQGSGILYHPRRGDMSFMKAPDWKRWPREAAAMLIKAIQKGRDA